MNTCRLGISQWCTAIMYPVPPSQASRAAARPVPADRISNSSGTRQT